MACFWGANSTVKHGGEGAEAGASLFGSRYMPGRGVAGDFGLGATIGGSRPIFVTVGWTGLVGLAIIPLSLAWVAGKGLILLMPGTAFLSANHKPSLICTNSWNVIIRICMVGTLNKKRAGHEANNRSGRDSAFQVFLFEFFNYKFCNKGSDVIKNGLDPPPPKTTTTLLQVPVSRFTT